MTPYQENIETSNFRIFKNTEPFNGINITFFKSTCCGKCLKRPVFYTINISTEE